MGSGLEEGRGHDGSSFVPLGLFLLFVVLGIDGALQTFHLLLLRNDKGVPIFAQVDLLVRSSLSFPNLVEIIYLGVPVDKLVILTVVDGIDSLGCHWYLSVYQVCG